MLFQRLSINRSQTLPLTLKNTGTIPATILLEVTREAQSFQLPSPDVEEAATSLQEDSSLLLNTLHFEPEEVIEYLVRFTPNSIKKFQGELWVTIKDNIYERFSIQLIGEGYEDDISLDNVRGQVEEKVEEIGEILDSDVEGM